jgi:hypothetical protein
MLNTIPSSIKDEINILRSFLNSNDLQNLKTDNLKFNYRTFKLHMYLQNNVPLSDEETIWINKKEKNINDSLVKEESEKQIITYKTGKGFTCGPISSLKCIFITIDQKVYDGIKNKYKYFKEKSMIDAFGLNIEDLRNHRKKVRTKIKRKRKRQKNIRKSSWKCGIGSKKKDNDKKILRSFMTDGISICARYQIVKISDLKYVNKIIDNSYLEMTSEEKKIYIKEQKKKTENLIILDAQKTYKTFSEKGNVRIIGQDDGRVNLFQTYENKKDGSNKNMRFTRFVYRKVSLSERLQKIASESRSTEILKIEGEISKYGGWKARNEENYIKVLNSCLKNLTSLLDYYCSDKLTLLRMVSYRRKQFVVNQRWKKIIGNIKKDESIMFATGSAKIGIAKRGEAPVPTTRNTKHLKRYLKCKGIKYKIIAINEYYTSQKCSCCHNQLKNIWYNNKIVRGLKLCKDEDCLKRNNNQGLRNRDANAAKNMLNILQSYINFGVRPSYLKAES